MCLDPSIALWVAQVGWPSSDGCASEVSGSTRVAIHSQFRDGQVSQARLVMAICGTSPETLGGNRRSLSAGQVYPGAAGSPLPLNKGKPA